MISEGETERTVPNNPDCTDPPEDTTGRISDLVSPVMDEEMTSTTIGIDEFGMSKSRENEPSESGDMRRPLTLKVASGDVTPATVI